MSLHEQLSQVDVLSLLSHPLILVLSSKDPTFPSFHVLRHDSLLQIQMYIHKRARAHTHITLLCLSPMYLKDTFKKMSKILANCKSPLSQGNENSVFKQFIGVKKSLSSIQGKIEDTYVLTG